MDAGEWQQAAEEREGDGDGKAGISIDGGGVGGGVTRAIRFKTPLHVRVELLWHSYGAAHEHSPDAPFLRLPARLRTKRQEQNSPFVVVFFYRGVYKNNNPFVTEKQCTSLVSTCLFPHGGRSGFKVPVVKIEHKTWTRFRCFICARCIKNGELLFYVRLLLLNLCGATTEYTWFQLVVPRAWPQTARRCNTW